MREIDDAHQAENQGEAGRHQEIERAKRDAAKQCIEEDLLAAPTRRQFRRPGCQHKPQERRDQEDDRSGSSTDTLDEVVHLRTARQLPVADLRHRWNKG